MMTYTPLSIAASTTAVICRFEAAESARYAPPGSAPAPVDQKCYARAVRLAW
jgi:hypothetical protein